jgi:acetyltransferase-like isoleucine patch superfamily enzyme
MIRKLLGLISYYLPPPFTKYVHKLRGVQIKELSSLFIGTHVNIDNKYPSLVSIGKEVTIASGARLTAHMDPPRSIREKFMQARALPIVVGDNVFIGANATILMGVTIHNWSIVGAGAVVTKDVPEYAIVVGNPARVVGDLRNYKAEEKPSETFV